jgi:hypothetical protein
MLPKLLVLAALVAWGAYGDIVYQIDNPVQSGSPGDILRFYGTVTDTGPDSFSAGFGHTVVGVWPNAFEITFPVFPDSGFTPGVSYSGELFDILITPAAAGLDVDADSYLYGWPDGSDPQDFNAVQFSNPVHIVVTTTPEPATGGLLFLGITALLGFRRFAR